MTRLALSLFALCTLAACSGSPEETQPVDAPTQTEREALDDAAEMLDEQPMPDETPQTGEADKGTDAETPQ